MRGSPRIGSVAARRCSIFFSIGIDHGSISKCDDHVATCVSTSLNVISCVEAILLAAATSSARNAVARSDASLIARRRESPTVADEHANADGAIDDRRKMIDFAVAHFHMLL